MLDFRPVIQDDASGNPRSTIQGVPYVDDSLQKALIEVGKSQGSLLGRKVLLWDPKRDKYSAVYSGFAFLHIGKVRATERVLQKAFHHRGLSPYFGGKTQVEFSKGLLTCMSPSPHKERYGYSSPSVLKHTTLKTSGALPLSQAKKAAILRNEPFDIEKEGFNYTPFDQALATALINVGKMNLNRKFFERKNVVVLNTENNRYEIIKAPYFDCYASHHKKVDPDFLKKKFAQASLPEILIPNGEKGRTRADVQWNRTFFTEGLLSCYNRVDECVKSEVYSAFMGLVHTQI